MKKAAEQWGIFWNGLESLEAMNIGRCNKPDLAYLRGFDDDFTGMKATNIR